MKAEAHVSGTTKAELDAHKIAAHTPAAFDPVSRCPINAASTNAASTNAAPPKPAGDDAEKTPEKPADKGTPKKAAAKSTTGGSGEETDDVSLPPIGRRISGMYIGMVGWTLGLVVSVLGLGFLTAQDFGHLLKGKLGKSITYVDEKSIRNAAYEHAEAVALNGHHVEAIKLFQALLVKYPGHTHSLLRIAELYDKNLQDFPRAAHHYEQLLEQPLPSEQWGWIAIHLCNLYTSKLSNTPAALALLRRLAAEHPETEAGGKALKRLARIDAAGLNDELQKDV